jgi:hypothetical protein
MNSRLRFGAKPEVATMKSKSLLALALTAAVGGPAWSQDAPSNPSASGGIGPLVYSALHKWALGWATGESPAPRAFFAPSDTPRRGLSDRSPKDHGKENGGNGVLNPGSRESLEPPASQNPFEVNPDRADRSTDNASDNTIDAHDTSRSDSSSSDPYDPYHTRRSPNDQSALYDPYNLNTSNAGSGWNTNDVSASANRYLHALAPPADGSVLGWDGKDPAMLEGPKDGFDRGLGDKLYDSLSLPTAGRYGGPSATTTVGSTPYGTGKEKTELDGDPSGILGFNPYDAKSILAPTSRSGSLAVGDKSKSLESLNSLLPSNPLDSLPSTTNSFPGSTTLRKQGY